MDFVTLGLCISFFLTCMLLALLSYERRHGVRFLHTLRTKLDFFVLRSAYALHTLSKRLGGSLIRQIFHYLFHTCIGLIRALIRRFDRALRNVMHVNKTLAKTAARDSRNRSKLEEIALHKVASALSEEEKRIRKDKVLNDGI